MFVGRVEEIKVIDAFLKKNHAAILVVYGRRRVGKTALIELSLKKKKVIKIEGKQGQPQKAQLQHALYTLSKYFKDPDVAKLSYKTWTEVFDWIANKTKKGQWVIYLEELQWLANYQDELISDLKEAWDNSFSKNSQLKLILCGSAPSFMITHVVKSKALYNRSQYTLSLKEFTPEEVLAFFKNKKNKQEVMDAILSVGGIPEYLKYLLDESSVFLSLCKNSSNTDDFFVAEYGKIFTSSLAQNQHYKKIIEYLALNKFADREKILKHLDIHSGGTISNVFEDLIQCGFIEEISPYYSKTKSRLVRYAISDAYLQFYFKFINPKLKVIAGRQRRNPQNVISITEYRKWLGYAFERWCRRNHYLIATTLGFGAIEYEAGAYFRREHLGSSFQIDLIFQRKDRVLSICEIKYKQEKITTSIVGEFEEKLQRLKIPSGYSIQKVLIVLNEYQESLRNYFDRILTLDEIF